VEDRTRVALGAAVGAALGAFVGYLFTARGRQLRRQLEPHVDTFARRTGLAGVAEPLRQVVLGEWGTLAGLLLGGGHDDRTSRGRPGSQVH